MKTIMIVDDSRIMRNIVRNIFELLKIPVNYLEADNGKKALELLLNNPVDLVLLDWNMPGLSGIDFLKQVRAIEKFRNLPVIMVTSESSKLNVVEAVKAGVTAYITKPIKEEIFMRKISMYINQE